MAQGIRRKVLLRSGEGALGVGTGCVPCMCACIRVPCCQSLNRLVAAVKPLALHAGR